MSASAARKIEAAPVTIASATVDRIQFRKALNAVLPIVERRNAIPILGCVRIGIEPDRITFGSTDLDSHLSTSMAADTVGTEALAVDAPRSLAALLGKMSAKSVDLSFNDDRGRRFVSVSAGAIQAEFPTHNVDDFPVPRVQPEKTVKLHFGGAQLLEAITRVAFAISTEKTRYYLNGIYLTAANSGDGSVLRIVATDGHRLALSDIAPDLTLPSNALPERFGCIIPRKAVSLLAEFARQGAVDVAFSDMRVWAKSGDTTLCAKLIDGTFPDYERVIPSGNDKSAILPSDLIRLALARVSLGSTERTKACKITLGRDEITMQSRSVGGLSITEAVPLPEKPNMPNSAFEHGLNARYFSESLRHFPGAATYRWAGAASPLIIHAADISQEQATHLVVLMPMRV